MSYGSSISADGRYVAFHSFATNLVPGDTNDNLDVFVHDRQTGTTERVNVAPGDAQVTDGADPKLSANGRFVLFASGAATLVSGDTNAARDVFLRDRQTNTNTRVSVATGGGEASAASGGAGVTPGQTGPAGAYGISDDGRYTVFASDAANLVADDTNASRDVFLRDLQAGTTVRVSLGPGGGQGNGHSGFMSMSATGRYIVFASSATNLVPGDTNGAIDIFVRDVQTGTTTRVSVGPGGVQGNASSDEATVSADGRFVAFQSAATNLDSTGRGGIYVHDRESGVTSLLVAIGPLVVEFRDRPFRPQITGDGRFVCYTLFDVTNTWHVMRIDRQTLELRRVNVRGDGALTGASVALADCAPNFDGSVIAFSSDDSTLVANDTNAMLDVFVRTLIATPLSFGAVTNGARFVWETAQQIVQLKLAQDAQWTATSDRPWLLVSPSSGVGPKVLHIGVAFTPDLPPNGTVTGTVSLSRIDTTLPFATFAVTLTLKPGGSSTSPFGSRRYADGQSHWCHRRGAVHRVGARRYRGDACLDLPRRLRL